MRSMSNFIYWSYCVTQVRLCFFTLYIFLTYCIFFSFFIILTFR